MTTLDGPTGSTVPRRQLGRILGELRDRAGFKAKDAARALERSPVTLWRIEKGTVSSRGVEVKAMCDLYDAPKDLTEALVALAKETKARGWWHAYGDVIPEGFDLYIGLEEAASRIDWYEPDLVPGLLQTEGYARTIIGTGYAEQTSAEIERRVQLRLKRRVLLTRVTAPPQVNVVVNDAAVQRPVGGHTVMAEQLTYLSEIGKLPNVTVRILPFSAGLHQGCMTGRFQILRFPLTPSGKNTEPPTVYSDGYTGDLYLDKPNEVEHYDRAFQEISSAALTEEASRRLILEMVGRYE
ncbi:MULTISPECIES: helix-turn-helix domain-containing protein [Streptomyces]|uniref:helix-turn-helix domain-containing protein n=1 Tax=Streptomyces TaxID=1883 RepID=UPI00345BAD13